MPVLHDPPEETLPPAFPPWLMVACVASSGVSVYLAFHRMRDVPAWGMDGAALQNATLLAMGVFFVTIATGAWLARRSRVRD